MKTFIQQLALCGVLAGTGVVLANCQDAHRASVTDTEGAPTTNSQTARLPSGADQTANAPTTTTDPLGAHDEDRADDLGTGGSGKMTMDGGTAMSNDAGTDGGTATPKHHKK